MEGYQKFEKHFKGHEVHRVDKFDYRGFTVYLWEGGPYTDPRKVKEYPNGWYESGYGLERGGKPLFYMPIEFDYLHDLQWSREGRRKARINTARKTAINHVNEFQKMVDIDG